MLAELDRERARLGLTFAGLARAVDPAANYRTLGRTVKRLLTGRARLVDVDELEAIARALGLELDLLPAAKRRRRRRK